MEVVKVYSPIEDKKIRENLKDSPIWKDNYHESELLLAKAKYSAVYEYQIKFDGLKPIMVNKVQKINF